MGDFGGTVRKRKGRLAVFEHVSHKVKRSSLRKSSFCKMPNNDDSDLDLVIDDEEDVSAVSFSVFSNLAMLFSFYF